MTIHHWNCSRGQVIDCSLHICHESSITVVRTGLSRNFKAYTLSRPFAFSESVFGWDFSGDVKPVVRSDLVVRLRKIFAPTFLHKCRPQQEREDKLVSLFKLWLVLVDFGCLARWTTTDYVPLMLAPDSKLCSTIPANSLFRTRFFLQSHTVVAQSKATVIRTGMA